MNTVANRRTEVLPELLEIWRKALGQQAGPDDDFFAVGGDSIIATLIITRLRQHFGVELTLANFLSDVTTPANLAQQLSRTRR
jgi:acyl carrier protein